MSVDRDCDGVDPWPWSRLAGGEVQVSCPSRGSIEQGAAEAGALRGAAIAQLDVSLGDAHERVDSAGAIVLRTVGVSFMRLTGADAFRDGPHLRPSCVRDRDARVFDPATQRVARTTPQVELAIHQHVTAIDVLGGSDVCHALRCGERHEQVAARDRRARGRGVGPDRAGAADLFPLSAVDRFEPAGRAAVVRAGVWSAVIGFGLPAFDRCRFTARQRAGLGRPGPRGGVACLDARNSRCQQNAAHQRKPELTDGARRRVVHRHVS